MHIIGKCHCGNIRFALEWPASSAQIPARACGCSFCLKHAGVWTSHPDANLVVEVRDSALASQYAFGTETAQFHLCTRCGCVPLATCTMDDRLYAVVNVNMFEGIDSSTLHRSTADVEGENVESRLARRQRNWIANVRFT